MFHEKMRGSPYQLRAISFHKLQKNKHEGKDIALKPAEGIPLKPTSGLHF